MPVDGHSVRAEPSRPKTRFEECDVVSQQYRHRVTGLHANGSESRRCLPASALQLLEAEFSLAA
jgi:hypothetical protein